MKIRLNEKKARKLIDWFLLKCFVRNALPMAIHILAIEWLVAVNDAVRYVVWTTFRVQPHVQSAPVKSMNEIEWQSQKSFCVHQTKYYWFEITWKGHFNSANILFRCANRLFLPWNFKQKTQPQKIEPFLINVWAIFLLCWSKELVVWQTLGFLVKTLGSLNLAISSDLNHLHQLIVIA